MDRLEQHSLWVERYRPQTLDDYIGNDLIKSKVKLYLENKDIPHLLFSGPAGTGKTSLAKLITNHIECDLLYVNASDENNVDNVRNKIKLFTSSVGFKSLKVVILDEADFLTPNAQAALRNIMETFSKHSRFILTCNYAEKIIDPIQSRCQVFTVIPPDRKELAVHLAKILSQEDIDNDPKDVVTLVNACYPDIRRVINLAQKQSLNGSLMIDEESSILNDYKIRLLEILKTKDRKVAFKESRQLLADNKLRDFADIYRLLYDTIDDWGKGHIPECILILADGQYQDAHAVDKEINFMSTLIKILGAIK